MSWQLGLSIGALVYLAFVLDLFGFLARDELWLRLLMLAASALYIMYYYWVAAVPLWDAITTNAALAGVNLVMIVVVVLERTTFSMSAETADIYRRFGMLSPGQFRRILRAAQQVRVTQAHELLADGAPVDTLYFVLEGPVEIEKNGRISHVEGGIFIGEIGFLTSAPASARVSVAPGARYLKWSSENLRSLLGKSPALNVAMGAQFNVDLVGKVARSQPGSAA